ncbi:pilus assembly protein TadG-related protein [Vibrio sp. HN007]|uniref:pilus assembly protein TadG-related protein n=1 Tax=Vibrio iocasae TaxID=3098914 RepID=UPI0035D408E7
MNPRLKQRTSPRKQKGLVAVLITVAFALMIGFAALAIDVNHMVLNKARLQNAVDAAAIAGAKQADQTDSAADVNAAVTEALDKFDDAVGNTVLTLTGADAPTVVIQMANDAITFPGVGVNQASDIYVRVEITSYQLDNYFISLFGINKAVTVSAVAGPSSGAREVCNIVPMAVCSMDSSDTNGSDGTFLGYSTEKAYALKLQDNVSDMGSGNYQLLDFGSGASSVRSGLAGDYAGCISMDGSVTTKPGNTVGPVADGLNTRFDEHTGPMKGTESQYPPDKFIYGITDYNTVVYDEDLPYEDSVKIYDSNVKNPKDSTPEAADPWGYEEYLDEKAACNGSNSGGCRSSGVTERRTLAVPMIDCGNPLSSGGGTNQFNVDGIGCFFLLEKASSNSGKNSLPVIGEFLEDCTVEKSRSDGSSGVTVGPYRIVLYKDPMSEES